MAKKKDKIVDTVTPKKAKKNAELNFFQRIYRKFGFTLPFCCFLIVVIFSGVGVYSFLKGQELSEVRAQKLALENELKTYGQEQGNYIKEYADMKGYYNDYRGSLLNFSLIFSTIEKYIPKDMQRERLSINKKGDGVDITLNGQITGYNAYMSILNVIDKCNFTDEDTKRQLLNVSKVSLGGEKGDEQLGEQIAFNYKFQFSTSKNKYLLQKTYEKALKDFANLNTLLNYNNITLRRIPDRWDKDMATNTDNIKSIVQSKMDFLSQVAEIRNTDINGYYNFETGENFINTMRTEQKLTKFYITYLNDIRKRLEDFYAVLNEDNEGIYYNPFVSKTNPSSENSEAGSGATGTGTADASSETANTDNGNKGELIVDVKKEITEQLEEINNKIIELYILDQYYTYLLKNNYLSTFTNIAKQTDKTFAVTIDGVEKELTPDEYIINIINTQIIPENTDIFNILLNLYPEEERETMQQELYAKYVTFSKGIDEAKAELIKVENYSDKFYEYFYKSNLYDISNKVLTYYIDTTKYNDEFLENIQIPFFDFLIDSNLLSYKNRFILNIKNDSVLKTNIFNIANLEGFVTELNNLELFLKETADIITFNNNNVECLVSDTKQEAKKVYEGILDQKTETLENETEIKELDIIIQAVN